MAERSIPFEWRWAIIHSDSLSSTTKLVLLTLSVFMNKVGYCYPSMDTLAKRTGLSRKCVGQHIGIAREAGWIKVIKNFREGQQWRAHSYQVLFPKAGERSSPASRDVVNLKPKACELEGPKVGNYVPINITENKKRTLEAHTEQFKGLIAGLMDKPSIVLK